VTPFYVAFPEVAVKEMDIIGNILNAFFIADLVLSFNTAYFKKHDSKVVDNYIVISFLFIPC
jgi:hypothetical protein